MTFIQYYIEQFRDFADCWKLCRIVRRRLILETLFILLNPLCIYIMYKYDTGILKSDARYMKKERRND